MESGIQPWLFHVEPYEGESLSHFLGRVRIKNHLSPSGLGKLAGIGAVIARWERFHFNPYPTKIQLEALSHLLGVDLKRLRKMLPAQGEAMKCEPIRLCGACYAEAPCHRIEWQYQSRWRCEHHNSKLLTKCPNCSKKFLIPALWERGCCNRCGLRFLEMI